jgi:hypothetical protein
MKAAEHNNPAIKIAIKTTRLDQTDSGDTASENLTLKIAARIPKKAVNGNPSWNASKRFSA